VALNLFTEGIQIQTYNFVREPHYGNFNTSQLTFLFHNRTRSVTQNIRGFIERLPRAAQKVFGSRMRLPEEWLTTNDLQ